MDPALSSLAKSIESGQPWPRPSCPTCQTGYVRFSEPKNDEGQIRKHERNRALSGDWRRPRSSLVGFLQVLAFGR